MFNQSSRGTKTRTVFLLTVILAITLVTPLSAPGHQQESPEWKRGLELYEVQNFVAAVPLLEQAAVSQPDNIAVLSRLGFALFAVAGTEKDLTKRKKMQDRARQILLKSQAHGDDSNLTKITLDGLAGEGEMIPYSQIKAAETAIREGEAAFVRGDLDDAIKAYKRALELDPRLYDAALYAGDCEFKKAYLSKDAGFRKEHFEQAGIWFAKAIAIEANRETAFRYWGDALDQQGKTEEARDKFVDAIVAEPFNQKGYMGLSQWANRHRIAMGHPKIVVPTNVSSAKLGEITVTVDEQALKQSDKEGGAAWLMYGLTRASWMPNKSGPSEKFSKAHPGETQYRHSLAEEVEALKMTAESAMEQMKGNQISSLDASLVNLIKIKDAGLLEAYVLFVRIDEGISRDYAHYRSSNRDKLKRYWVEIVITR